MKSKFLLLSTLTVFGLAVSCKKDDDSTTTTPTPVTPAPIVARINTAKLTQGGGKWSATALRWNTYKADGTLERSSGNDKYDAAYYWDKSITPFLTFTADGSYTMTERAFFSDILPVENGAWKTLDSGAKLELPTITKSGTMPSAWTVAVFTDTKMELKIPGTSTDGKPTETVLKFER